MRLPVAVRFWALVQKGADCWLWSGFNNPKGYGNFTIESGRVVLSHRFAYEISVGVIPEGSCVLHRCDTPACVNPAHLFIGSKADNNADMMAKGRYARGERNGLSKLDDARVQRIRAAVGTHRSIAAEFGVHQSTVTRIKSGVIWRATA